MSINLRSSILALTLLLCTVHRMLAASFTVTSNGDSGPGTLREAITQANSNGTAVTDYIYFNLPATTLSSRTILFNSDLPAFTDNIVIDASGQPGSLIGINGAKVIISPDPAIPSSGMLFYVFQLVNVQNVQLYGLCLKPQPGSQRNGYAIYLNNATNITIGAPLKGNVINGFNRGIFQDAGLVNNITIQNNIIGLDEDGVGESVRNLVSISFFAVQNITLGGNTEQEGNVIVGETLIEPRPGIVKVGFNKFGTVHSGMAVAGIFDGYNTLNISGSAMDVQITDNLFGSGGIYMFNLQSKFSIQRNKIGTDITGQTIFRNSSAGIQAGITIINCPQPGTIGGNGNGNIIAGVYGSAIGIGESYAVTVSQNSLFCNYEALGLGWDDAAAGRPAPFVNITVCNAGGFGGDATPDSKIEIFESDACGLLGVCQGKKYVTSIMADASGKWFYATAATTGFIVTATDPQGATSEYSTAKIDFNTFGITHASCGKNTGKITMKVLRGYGGHWEDQAGNIISYDTSLVNVPAGFYSFVLTSGNCNACTMHLGPYEVRDVTPHINTAYAVVQQASCGQRNGSVRGLELSGQYLRISWKDAAGNVVGNMADLENVGPGTYTLTIQDTIGACNASEGPYTITNLSGPALNAANVAITAATCGQRNGSIKGIQVTGTGTITYQWLDTNGTIYSTAPDLLDVPGGKYTLQYQDDSGCPPVSSPAYEVPGGGMVPFSISGLTTTPAHCNQDNGSITDVILTGGNPASYQWRNAADQTVSADISATNLPAGDYHLMVTDASGCEQQAGSASIPQATAPLMEEQQAMVRPDQCNEGTGGISGVIASGEAPFTYTWYRNGDITGNSAGLTNIKAGTYYLEAKDKYGCPVRSKDYLVTNSNAELTTPLILDITIIKGADASLLVSNPQSGRYYLCQTPSYNTLLDSSDNGAFMRHGLQATASFYVSRRQGDCFSPFSKVTVTVVESIGIYVPTAFTPNGDGLNDLLRLKAPGLASLEYFTVFGRWGTTVFSTKDIRQGWDGTFKGHVLAVGAYVWVLKGKDILGHIITQSGSVILMR
jgi:gliding motility-associated-like protein